MYNQVLLLLVLLTTISNNYHFILVFISNSNDGGIWTLTSAPSSSNTFWNSITSDSSGSRLAAVQYNGGIYTSTSG